MKRSLMLILSFYLLQGIIHNLGHVVTPVYVQESGIPKYMFGFFFSAMSLGLLIGAPIWGVLGDSRPKKPFIVIGLLGYSIGQVMFVSTSNLYLMTFFRFFSGFSVSASMTLFLSQIIHLSEPAKRTKYLSISAALFALGSTIGYKIGGSMGTFFIVEVFYIQGILNAFYALFVLITLKELAPARLKERPSFLKGFRDATKMDASLLVFLLALTIATTAATNVQRYLDAYVTIDLNYSTNDLGNLVLISGIVGIITNFVIVPWLAKMKKDFVFMQWLQLLSALVIFIAFRSSIIAIAILFYMFYIVLKSIYQPLEQNYVSLNAKEEKYASIMGVRQAFFALGMIIGPLIGGFLYNHRPELVFDTAAIMFVLAFVLLMVSRRSLKNKAFKEPLTAPQHLETTEYKAAP